MVHEFFEIHGPSTFWNSMSQRFLRLWAIKQASPGRGGGPYYMIFHYQKHTVLNYYGGQGIAVWRSDGVEAAIERMDSITVFRRKNRNKGL